MHSLVAQPPLRRTGKKKKKGMTNPRGGAERGEKYYSSKPDDIFLRVLHHSPSLKSSKSFRRGREQGLVVFSSGMKKT